MSSGHTKTYCAVEVLCVFLLIKCWRKKCKQSNKLGASHSTAERPVTTKGSIEQLCTLRRVSHDRPLWESINYIYSLQCLTSRRNCQNPESRWGYQLTKCHSCGLFINSVTRDWVTEIGHYCSSNLPQWPGSILDPALREEYLTSNFSAMIMWLS